MVSFKSLTKTKMVCGNFKPRVFIEEPNFLSINSRLGYTIIVFLISADSTMPMSSYFISGKKLIFPT